MIKHKSLQHVFVDSFPSRLEPGKLYVSVEYGSVAHSCCCGCGEEIVTPLTPTDWHIVYDGETITLHPSVGNWTLACRSHYVIRKGEVIEAPAWSDQQVAAERRRDGRAKAAYFGTTQAASPSIASTAVAPERDAPQYLLSGNIGWKARIRRFWTKIFR